VLTGVGSTGVGSLAGANGARLTGGGSIGGGALAGAIGGGAKLELGIGGDSDSLFAIELDEELATVAMVGGCDGAVEESLAVRSLGATTCAAGPVGLSDPIGRSTDVAAVSIGCSTDVAVVSIGGRTSVGGTSIDGSSVVAAGSTERASSVASASIEGTSTSSRVSGTAST
jgi:hypothetical protein